MVTREPRNWKKRKQNIPAIFSVRFDRPHPFAERPPSYTACCTEACMGFPIVFSFSRYNRRENSDRTRTYTVGYGREGSNLVIYNVCDRGRNRNTSTPAPRSPSFRTQPSELAIVQSAVKTHHHQKQRKVGQNRYCDGRKTGVMEQGMGAAGRPSRARKSYAQKSWPSVAMYITMRQS